MRLRVSLLPFAAVCLSSIVSAQTWTDSTLYTFTIEHELEPGPLMQASDGNFYGILPCITAQCNGYIYQVTPAGAYTLLYSFSGGNDGEHPVGRLIEGPDGNLYGTTSLGGANANGTVFRIPLGTSGALKTIYTVPAFQANAPTNCYKLPSSGLTLGSDGNFYIASGGGGGGCMWSVTPAGAATLDVNATGIDATFSYVPTQGADGNWYIPGGDGMVAWTPGSGSTSFTNIALKTDSSQQDGLGVDSELVQGPDGDFYFTDTGGGSGAADNYLAAKGTISGTATILYEFGSTGADSGLTGLFLASDGNFYGAQQEGGANSDGYIYKLSSSGTFTHIFDFDGTNGAVPFNMPLQGSDGNLYGVTQFSGSPSAPSPGVVWKLTATNPALKPPVQMSFTPTNPAPGSAATINWSVSNAFSTTMQQCYAYGNWTGKQAGSYSSTTHLYTGSAKVTIPASGGYTYALTCGGRESQRLVSSLLASSTSLSVTPASVTVGGSVKISVKVSGSGPTPSGSVTLEVDGTTLGVLTLSDGSASISVSSAGYAAGTYPLVATYSGDSDYQGSVSNTVNVTLKAKAATTTALTVTPNPVTPPATVTVTATVTGSSGTATGSVTFYAAGQSLATVDLSDGVAKLTTSTSGIAAGTYPVSAKYSGDANNSASTSNTVDVKVN